MQEFKDWKEFINRILIDSGQFENPISELKNDTEIETFKSTDKDSLTEIRVGYLKNNRLIYLQFFNPKIAGYNKLIGNEYFTEGDLNDIEDHDTFNDYGDVGLEFNKRNTKQISIQLETGLEGKEVQYLRNSQLVKSVIYFSEDESGLSWSHDFRKGNILKRIFRKKAEKIDGIKKQEINLNEIFSGIKTCYNTVYN
jgi:hypothetical protein